MSQSEFELLKATLVSRNQLWEDPDFPASRESLGVEERRSPFVRWLRPWDIVGHRSAKPMFVVEGATRFDLYQGQLGDCWFVAATACLAIAPQQLFHRVIPLNQDFEHNYAGIFRFNFWHFGRWVEVFVDDRLPTINNRLVYGHNVSQPNEFWVPLVEKAYAKLQGNYDNIGIGGHTTNALVDFTGGISESIDLRKIRSSPGDLFDVMYAMMQKSSMMACDIQSQTVATTPESNGLYKGHAYSITNVIRLTSKDETLRLLRLRNPWGKNEWLGPWSDRSLDWQAIPDQVKQEIGMQVKREGEFWMSFEDFLMNFDFLWVCHLEPDAISEEIAMENHQAMWESTKYMSEWISGYNAGGCGNPPNQYLFWRNPQFSLTIPADADHVTDVVVSLMQESLRIDQNFSIGFMIYKVREGSARLLDGENYDRSELRLTQPPNNFINLREVTVHSQLEPGQYVIIPCTFYPNQQIKFLLRVFTETAAQSEELDDSDIVDSAPQVEDSWSKVFDKYANGATTMDAAELTQALNAVLRTNKPNEFTLDAARNVIDMFTADGSCLVSREQFHAIIKQLSEWKNKFDLYDKDSSNSVDTYELTELYRSIGIQLSRRVMSSIVRRYGGKDRRLSFTDFVLTACRINVMYQYFVKAKNPQTNRLDVSLKDFLAETV